MIPFMKSNNIPPQQFTQVSLEKYYSLSGTHATQSLIEHWKNYVNHCEKVELNYGNVTMLLIEKLVLEIGLEGNYGLIS